MGVPIEFKAEEEVLYIKFDFLPYRVRSFIHAKPDYDPSKMKKMERECACGQAYFYEADSFYNYLTDYEDPKFTP